MVHSDEELEPEVTFKNSDKRLKVFKYAFFPEGSEELSLKQAILYAIRYHETDKKCVTTDDFNYEIFE